MVWTTEVWLPRAGHSSVFIPSRAAMASTHLPGQWVLLLLDEGSAITKHTNTEVKEWLDPYLHFPKRPHDVVFNFAQNILLRGRFGHSAALSFDTPVTPQWAINPALYLRCHVSKLSSDTGWRSFCKGFSCVPPDMVGQHRKFFHYTSPSHFFDTA
jgi:hypothetical protein